jgi:putative transposase
MKEQNDKKFEVALWRYGIISPLLHKDANDIPVGELLDQASWRQYVHPDGYHVSLSAETLRKWRYRYLISGLPGLTGQIKANIRSLIILVLQCMPCGKNIQDGLLPK